MNEWADGIVYHQMSDGTLLYYDPQQRQWLKAPRPTSPGTRDNV
jgi:hypothetical protein